MKGIVFTEFLDMVDDTFGIEITEEIIQQSPTLCTGGAYTAVGTYPHEEIVGMVVALSKTTNTPVPNLIEAFGKHLFGALAKSHPHFLTKASNLFDFLDLIEQYIHIEVKKLYPDAQLPSFETLSKDVHKMEMMYHSERSMADLAVGLISGAAEKYNEEVSISLADQTSEQNGKQVKITIEHCS